MASDPSSNEWIEVSSKKQSSAKITRKLPPVERSSKNYAAAMQTYQKSSDSRVAKQFGSTLKQS